MKRTEIKPSLTRKIPATDGPIADSAIPRGFSFASIHCGLKRKRPDLGLLVSDLPATAAAVFTTNLVHAAPVKVSREHMDQASSSIRGVVVNSGNANCSTGPDGILASRDTTTAVARELGCRPEEVLICSTGVIGVPLPVEKILDALPGLAPSRAKNAEAFKGFAHAILTTDLRPKWASAKCRIGGKQVRISGCAKGSGMIHPQMATMLAFLATDAAVPQPLLQAALQKAVADTFNSITVDGDTSTNDTVFLLANGASGAPAVPASGADFDAFFEAVERVCKSLALAIVEDGEGAQRVIEIEVRGAQSRCDADKVARTIANSSLVKTAFAGADANWGRILAAAGRSGVAFDPEQAEIRMAGVLVYRRGAACPFNEGKTHQKLLAKFVPVVVDLGCADAAADGNARIWTCDFTAEYVRINASYRT